MILYTPYFIFLGWAKVQLRDPHSGAGVNPQPFPLSYELTPFPRQPGVWIARPQPQPQPQPTVADSACLPVHWICTALYRTRTGDSSSPFLTSKGNSDITGGGGVHPPPIPVQSCPSRKGWAVGGQKTRWKKAKNKCKETPKDAVACKFLHNLH